MSRDGFVALRDIRLGGASHGAARQGTTRGSGAPTGAGGRPWTGPLAVLQAWSQVVRPPLSERASPSGWREGVLTLTVDEPRWLATLEILAPALCSEINAWLGSAAVTDIRLQRGQAEEN